MTPSRRECIENLCRLFIYHQNPVIEETRNGYKHLLRPLLVDSHPILDIGDFIENVGNKLFNSRPANMAYICFFMEFVCEVHDKIDSVTIEQLIISAANVIEKTNFNVESKSLLRYIFSITSVVIDIFNHYILYIIRKDVRSRLRKWDHLPLAKLVCC